MILFIYFSQMAKASHQLQQMVQKIGPMSIFFFFFLERFVISLDMMKGLSFSPTFMVVSAPFRNMFLMCLKLSLRSDIYREQ